MVLSITEQATQKRDEDAYQAPQANENLLAQTSTSSRELPSTLATLPYKLPLSTQALCDSGVSRSLAQEISKCFESSITSNQQVLLETLLDKLSFTNDMSRLGAIQELDPGSPNIAAHQLKHRLVGALYAVTKLVTTNETLACTLAGSDELHSQNSGAALMDVYQRAVMPKDSFLLSTLRREVEKSVYSSKAFNSAADLSVVVGSMELLEKCNQPEKSTFVQMLSHAMQWPKLRSIFISKINPEFRSLAAVTDLDLKLVREIRELLGFKYVSGPIVDNPLVLRDPPLITSTPRVNTEEGEQNDVELLKAGVDVALRAGEEFQKRFDEIAVSGVILRCSMTDFTILSNFLKKNEFTETLRQSKKLDDDTMLVTIAPKTLGLESIVWGNGTIVVRDRQSSINDSRAHYTYCQESNEADREVFNLLMNVAENAGSIFIPRSAPLGGRDDLETQREALLAL